ncbi:MAG: S1C family serine protease [Alphaproteobacteria bacterium]|nr:S1C family serine protease [Alphaproteobacteria bacterium]
MKTRLLVPIMTALAAVLAGAGARGDEVNRRQETVVLCHDSERDVVTRSQPKDCRGEVVTEAEARKIKARRVRSMLRSVKPDPRPVVPDRKLTGIGSGFFIDESGTVVTNHHVINDCPAIVVQTTEGEMAEAVLLGIDERMDLALLKAEIAPAATAVFRAPVKLIEGNRVAVVGYPTQTLPPLNPKFTPGTFESNQRSGTHFAMKAAVRPGNSGGPVFDDRGHVIGVVVAQVNTVKTFESTGELIRDVGFAISNRTVFRFLDRNQARYRLGDGGTTMTRDEIFAHARPLITRVTCWK